MNADSADEKVIGFNIETFATKINQYLFGIIHSLLKYNSCSLIKYFILLLINFLQILHYPFHTQVTDIV